MPPIKNKLLFAISMVLVVVVLGFVVNRVTFLVRADRAIGAVTALYASNGRCGGKRKHNCTEFSADVKYSVQDSDYQLHVSAGSVRGWNHPVSQADYRMGSTVPVLYNRHNPSQSYRDTFFDVWGAPLMAFVAQISMFFGSFSERRRV